MNLWDAAAQGLVRFLANNLVPALVAGAVAWLLVALGIRLFRIRHGRLRLCLFMAPPIKSTLVLVGLMPALPWPSSVFRQWSAAAVDPAYVVPAFLAVTGLGMIVQSVRASRERGVALRAAEPAAAAWPRLSAAYQRLAVDLERERSRVAATCGWEPPVKMPALLVTRRPLASPMVIVDGTPSIVFPAALIDRLDDAQLRAALAHEVAHLLVRRRLSCTSTEWVRRLTAFNPFGLAMAAQLELEEEKACDDMAVVVTGDAPGYADMLLAGYRHASATRGGLALATIPGLMGGRPALAERIERQLADHPPAAGLEQQRLRFVCLTVLLVLVLFTG